MYKDFMDTYILESFNYSILGGFAEHFSVQPVSIYGYIISIYNIDIIIYIIMSIYIYIHVYIWLYKYLHRVIFKTIYIFSRLYTVIFTSIHSYIHIYSFYHVDGPRCMR